MGIGSEFKAFIARGNAVDLAVGVVIGAAFGKIVSSLVDEVIMPPLGLLIGGVDFSRYKWVLKHADAGGAGEVAIQYGAFINTIVQFVIIAAAIFLLVKVINRVVHQHQAEEDAAAPETAAEVELLTEIRDLLKAEQQS